MGFPSSLYDPQKPCNVLKQDHILPVSTWFDTSDLGAVWIGSGSHAYFSLLTLESKPCSAVDKKLSFRVNLQCY